MIIFGYVTGKLPDTSVRYTGISYWERYRKYDGNAPVELENRMEEIKEYAGITV